MPLVEFHDVSYEIEGRPVSKGELAPQVNVINVSPGYFQTVRQPLIQGRVFTDHDAPRIAEAVAMVLRSHARFVGMMGSRRHVGPYVEVLRSGGFSDQELARLRSPLGLDIGARTPPEIALSIAAGLVAAREERSGGWLDREGSRSAARDDAPPPH